MPARLITGNIPWAAQWLTWPALFLGTLALIMVALHEGWRYGPVLGVANLIAVITGITVESLWPLSPDWRMTWRTFRRDLKYMAIGIPSIAATNALFGLVSISLNTGHAGPLTALPLAVAAPLGLLATELLQYGQHRLSHESGCAGGRFLWRIHAAHHLSDRVYVLMHPANHPLNVFMVRGLCQVLPLYLLGVSPAAVLIISAVTTVQGIISHCNADLRAGWFNYLFSGTELHRYHHSAAPEESKNYAVTLSFIDILFGTFRYRPGRFPGRLGVKDPAHYPASYDVLQVMQLPFRAGTRARPGHSGQQEG